MEKNFKYDIEIVKRKIIFKAKYNMLHYISKKCRVINDENTILNLYEENYLIETNIYIENWLSGIEFTIIQKIVIDEIIKKLDCTTKYGREFFKQIYTKLEIEKKDFYSYIEDIKTLLIESGKVRITKCGGVLVVNE